MSLSCPILENNAPGSANVQGIVSGHSMALLISLATLLWMAVTCKFPENDISELRNDGRWQEATPRPKRLDKAGSALNHWVLCLAGFRSWVEPYSLRWVGGGVIKCISLISIVYMEVCAVIVSDHCLGSTRKVAFVFMNWRLRWRNYMLQLSCFLLGNSGRLTTLELRSFQISTRWQAVLWRHFVETLMSISLGRCIMVLRGEQSCTPLSVKRTANNHYSPFYSSPCLKFCRLLLVD